ncbi:hypothetical protein, partial [Micromonospora sp. NPDC051296]|uniref:hypothetical protein n=1 Tax=Micromonospora sp. NPDC051296 TaxID=3155046 RepID=UPI0034334C86
SRHPLFQASIVMQQRPSLLDPSYSAELAWRHPIGAVELSGFLDHPPMTTLDVELALFERDDDIEAVLTCRTDVIAPTDVPALADAFVAAVTRAARAPDLPVTEPALA